MLLTLTLLGSFFAVFSIFIRAIFPYEGCACPENIASILENLYLGIMFVVLMVSTMRKVDLSDR